MLNLINKHSIDFKAKTINLNLVYCIISLVIIFFIVYYLKIDQQNYLNVYNQSFNELILLIFVFILSVLIESYKKNIFLKILIFYSFVFFILRIPSSIIFFENSIFFKRNINDIQLKESILVLIYQYIFLYMSIIIINPTFKIDKFSINSKLIDFIIYILILFVFGNIIFNQFGTINYNSYSKFFTVIFNIFNSIRLNIFFSVLIFLIYRNNINIRHLVIKIIIFYFIFLLDTILNGSRSGIFTIILNLFILFLANTGTLKIKFKYIYFLPFLIVILLFIFSLTTSFKALNIYKIKDKIDLQLKLDVYNKTVHFFSHKKLDTDKEFFFKFLKKYYLSSLQGFTERIGYLDFFIEKYGNSIYYDKKINLFYYYKPALDRLSPGIDLFNVGFASKVLQEEYFNKFYLENKINKKYESHITNSEQITIFAETQILFGKFSIFYYLLILFLIKNLLIYIKKLDPLFKELTFGLILISYFDWLTSFGLDMTFVLTIYKFVCLYSIYLISKIYFFLKKNK